MFCVEMPALAKDWMTSSCGAEDLLLILRRGGARDEDDEAWSESV